MKSLKQTNFGKKIYDNLMVNYGQYLGNQRVKCPKKPVTVVNKKNPNSVVIKKEKASSSITPIFNSK